MDGGEGGARPDPYVETVPDTPSGSPSGPVEAQLGRYIVRRVIGAGGMGLVVAAHDPELGREVAIKLVTGDDEVSRARLIREAQAMARLSHANVVTVHEVMRIGDRATIVMALVAGDNLAAWSGGAGSCRRRSLRRWRAGRGVRRPDLIRHRALSRVGPNV